MKTIFFSLVAVSIFAITAHAQRVPGNSKHPYGLTKASKQQTAPLQKAVDATTGSVVRRNYKNPQTDEGTLSVVLPSRPVETVNNPLVAQDNYKRQNSRRKPAGSAPAEERIIAKERDEQKQ